MMPADDKNNPQYSTQEYALGIFFGAFSDDGLVRRHVELRRPFSSENRQPLLGRRLEEPIVDLAVLVLRLDVQDVLLVEHERLVTAGRDFAGPPVDFEPAFGCGENVDYSDREVKIWKWEWRGGGRTYFCRERCSSGCCGRCLDHGLGACRRACRAAR